MHGTCIKIIKNYNLAFVSTHALTEAKDQLAREELYSTFEQVCDAVHTFDTKAVLGDVNDQVGKESYLYSPFGRQKLLNETIDTGKRIVNFALGRDSVVKGNIVLP